MFGLTDFVQIITIHGIVAPEKKPTDFFKTYATVRIAAERTMTNDTIGNQQIRSDIDKQCYPHDSVRIVKQAFGLAGVRFDEYTAFRGWRPLSPSEPVTNHDEIVLVNNALLTETKSDGCTYGVAVYGISQYGPCFTRLPVNNKFLSEYIGRHKVLPARFDRR